MIGRVRYEFEILTWSCFCTWSCSITHIRTMLSHRRINSSPKYVTLFLSSATVSPHSELMIKDCINAIHCLRSKEIERLASSATTATQFTQQIALTRTNIKLPAEMIGPTNLQLSFLLVWTNSACYGQYVRSLGSGIWYYYYVIFVVRLPVKQGSSVVEVQICALICLRCSSEQLLKRFCRDML